MRIGIDAMGGDFAPEANVLGAILAHNDESLSEDYVLFGDEPAIVAILEREGIAPSTFEIVHTTDVIGMGEHATRAIARKPNSSIGLGFKYLKEGKISAFSSTGNTGAMLVGAMYSVKATTGVIRPCVTTVMPQPDGGISIVLDAGANADCKPDVLYQFGILGSVFAETVYGIKNPKVGLLNIGEEEEKGNLLARAAFEIMKDSSDFNFIGNVEGRDLFDPKVDVIVCDGFTGNVVLKQAEAVYGLVKERNIDDAYFNRFNYEIYGGTPILGINSNVIIGHGISTPLAVKNMLVLAKNVAKAELPSKIKAALE